MNIAYIGNIGAEGTAMAIHAQNIANLLVELGHDVSFICSEPGFDKKKINGNEKYSYTYVKRNFEFPIVRSLEYRIELVKGNNLTSLLKAMNKKNRFDMVILYGYTGEKNIINYCKQNGILIIADRVDWFEKEDLNNTIFNRWFQKNMIDKSMMKLDKDLNGVISISPYLDRHYKNMNVNSIWMPPIFSDFDEKLSFDLCNPLVLVYAGNLGGNKDVIKPVIQALKIINQDEVNIRLDLVGISEEQIIKEFDDLNTEKIGITAYGFVPHAEAQKIISNADFGLLLRHNKRYAKAGFSTKFSECMSNGVPMICTSVGGADTIIDNYVDGILLHDNQVDTIVETLLDIIRMPNEKIISMKKSAYKKANNTFKSTVYYEKMQKFLYSISNK